MSRLKLNPCNASLPHLKVETGSVVYKPKLPPYTVNNQFSNVNLCITMQTKLVYEESGNEKRKRVDLIGTTTTTKKHHSKFGNTMTISNGGDDIAETNGEFLL